MAHFSRLEAEDDTYEIQEWGSLGWEERGFRMGKEPLGKCKSKSGVVKCVHEGLFL